MEIPRDNEKYWEKYISRKRQKVIDDLRLI